MEVDAELHPRSLVGLIMTPNGATARDRLEAAMANQSRQLFQGPTV